MSTIVCRGLSFGYDGPEQSVFTNLDLVIDTGWRSALVGRNGRGKTTLLRLIHGELAPDRGSIERAVVTRSFPTMPSDPAVSAFEAAKDAAGPFQYAERRSWREECTSTARSIRASWLILMSAYRPPILSGRPDSSSCRCS